MPVFDINNIPQELAKLKRDNNYLAQQNNVGLIKLDFDFFLKSK